MPMLLTLQLEVFTDVKDGIDINDTGQNFTQSFNKIGHETLQVSTYTTPQQTNLRDVRVNCHDINKVQIVVFIVQSVVVVTYTQSNQAQHTHLALSTL